MVGGYALRDALNHRAVGRPETSVLENLEIQAMLTDHR